MIRLQNVSQLAVFNFAQQVVPQKNTSINNNNLERSPRYDSVSFTGKFKEDEPEEILPIVDLDADDIVEVDEADLISDDDSAHIYDLEEQERCLREEEEAEEERRKREEAQLNDDIILYGVVLPEMAAINTLGTDTNSANFDNPLDIDNLNNDADYPSFDDDFSSFDDGFGF